jgi:methionyl-tRNA synthetase
MSKTRGTFIMARTYLQHLPPDYLRYYFAAKLGATQEDIDLSLTDFVARCNADLVNKAGNLASRCVKFVTSRLGGTLAALPPDAADLVARARARLAQVEALYREFDSRAALRLAMEVAEDANLYVTEAAPWKLAADDPERARAVCSVGIWASQVVAAILKPVLPAWAEKVERFLRTPAPLDFRNGADPLPAGHAIGEYETLAERIDPKVVEAIVEASKDSLPGTTPAVAGAPATTPAPAPSRAPASMLAVDPVAAQVGIEAFNPVDLRVAKVLACERVEGASKLLRLTLSLGSLGERQVLSGIAKSYAPEKLVGKHVVVFANLAPRTMKFGTSEGMILAAGTSDDAVTVLELDPATSRPGERVS